MSERVACTACGKWMFHLAQSCPHCGVPRAGAAPAPVDAAPPKAPPKKLELTPEEARSLLAASVPSAELNMTDVVTDLVLPRSGWLDLLLSLFALPLTGLTVAALGYGVLQTMRKKTPVNLRTARMLAVPTGAALAALALFRLEAGTERGRGGPSPSLRGSPAICSGRGRARTRWPDQCRPRPIDGSAGSPFSMRSSTSLAVEVKPSFWVPREEVLQPRSGAPRVPLR